MSLYLTETGSRVRDLGDREAPIRIPRLGKSSISGLTVLSGKNTDSIAGSTQIFIKVSKHKTRLGQMELNRNSGQRIETGREERSNQAGRESKA